MPISQDRVIALVRAGLDYQHAFDHLRQIISTQAARHRRGEISVEQALSTIDLMSSNAAAFLKTPLISPKILAVEEHHFRTHHRYNEKARERSRRRRQREGIVPRVERHDIFSIPADELERVEEDDIGLSFSTSDDEPEPDFENGAELSIDATEATQRESRDTGLSIFGVEIGRPEAAADASTK